MVKDAGAGSGHADGPFTAADSTVGGVEGDMGSSAADSARIILLAR
jgi:hypothetical protein